MKYSIGILLLFFTISSCSTLIVDLEELPNVNDITHTTINTRLPVINIEADPAEFDKMMAIYYNKIIVDGKINAISNAGEIYKNENNIKFEIRGRSSVGASFPLKSLGVTFDNPVLLSGLLEIAPSSILPGHHLDSLITTRLRSSGNDFGVTMIKDLAYSRFAVENRLNLEVMYGSPVQVFVNDIYYGLMNARSESSLAGMAYLLKLDPSSMAMVKVKDDSENLKYDEGNRQACEALLAAIENEDPQAIWDNVDIDNFIDYIIFQDYIGNADWSNNIKAFNPGNNKFRFILFDVDLAGNAAIIPLQPKLEFLSADLGKIYRALQENEGFNDRLEYRKKVLYSRFSVSKFDQIVDDLVATIENDIPYLMAKYGQPKSTLHWKIEIQKMKQDFKGRDRSIRKKYNLD